MGCFSWKAADTGRAIEIENNRTIYMLGPNGERFVEPAGEYDGYGRFGGKDIYEFIAELNGCDGSYPDEIRSKGIDLVFSKDHSGRFGFNPDVKYPVLVEDGNLTYGECVAKFGYPENDPNQGFGEE